ncbi:hypothetical protein GCM10008907_07960 [Clostridium sartagoforme]
MQGSPAISFKDVRNPDAKLPCPLIINPIIPSSPKNNYQIYYKVFNIKKYIVIIIIMKSNLNSIKVVKDIIYMLKSANIR